MCDKELLVGYLYDELDQEARQRFETHLASCGECREEAGAMRSTRRTLAAWTPPEPRLDFQVVSGAPPRRFAVSPLWGLAAAAVLVLAAASAIANIEIRYGRDGLVVRTGWARETAPTAPSVAPPVAAVAERTAPAEWTALVQALDARLQQLEKESRRSAATVQASAPRVSDADVIRRVREMLTESETRQNRELAMRIRQLAFEVDAQRRVDLAAIQQGIRGATGAEAASHQQLMNYMQGVLRVSQQVK